MSRNSAGASPIICRAIQQRRKLIFHYNGLRRVVTPYCYGISSRDREVLRAIEINGTQPSFGKLWAVGEMSQVELSKEHFEPNDPKYNPNDSAMKRILCRID